MGLEAKVEAGSGNALVSINVVLLRRARLVLGWVTVCERVNHLGSRYVARVSISGDKDRRLCECMEVSPAVCLRIDPAFGVYRSGANVNAPMASGDDGNVCVSTVDMTISSVRNNT